MKELITIQSRLVANKDKHNDFGNYDYRNLDTILNQLKPLLTETGCTLTFTDDLVLIGMHYYVKATATLKNSSGEVETVTAFAREQEQKKGTDEAQITGSASTYCRKYAVCGLFGISDGYDPDSMDNREKGSNKPTKPTKPTTTPTDPFKALKSAKSSEELNAIWAEHPELQNDAKFVTEINKRAAELNK